MKVRKLTTTEVKIDIDLSEDELIQIVRDRIEMRFPPQQYNLEITIDVSSQGFCNGASIVATPKTSPMVEEETDL